MAYYNGNKLWDEEEEECLKNEVCDARLSISCIAKNHSRTIRAIELRIKKLFLDDLEMGEFSLDVLMNRYQMTKLFETCVNPSDFRDMRLMYQCLKNEESQNRMDLIEVLHELNKTSASSN